MNRCDSHSRHTGGVIVYTKKGTRFKILKNFNLDKQLWLLGIELSVKNANYRVYGVYNRCAEAKYIKFLSDFCENDIDYSKVNVFVGDINIDLLSDEFYARKLKECINDSTMKQIITEPTRITKNSRTLIDHVMTNDVNSVKYRILNDEKISDHSTVSILLSGKESNKESEKIKILKYDENDLTNFFTANQCDLPRNVDVNEKSEFFMSLIRDFSNKFSKVIELTDKSDTKWFNNELRKLKKIKSDLYEKAVLTDSDNDWHLFKNARNKYVNKLNYACRMNTMQSIRKKRGDQKGMWRILKSLISKKGLSKPNYIIFDGENMEATKENEPRIANRFNKFFIEGRSC